MKFNTKFILGSCLSLTCIIYILFFLLIWKFVIHPFITELKYIKGTSKDDAVTVEDKVISGEKLFTVAIISDTESDTVTLGSFVAELPSVDSGVDAIFHSGDITTLGVLDDFDDIKASLGDLNKPVYYVPGDRDLWKSSGIENFNRSFGDSYRMVSIEGVNFMLIDNSDEYKGISAEEWKFIDANLNSTDFVIFHNPIYFNDTNLLGIMKKGMGHYSKEVDDQRLALLDKIRKSSVKATFSGDQHFYSRNVDDEDSLLVHYIVGALTSSRNLEIPNYLLLSVYKDGNYQVERFFIGQN